MSKVLKREVMRGIKIINVLAITAIFAYCWMEYYIPNPINRFRRTLGITVFLLLYFFIGRVYSAFTIGKCTKTEIVFSQGLTLLLTHTVPYGIAFTITRVLPPVLPIIGALIVQITFSIVWTFLSEKLYHWLFAPLRTVVLWSADTDVEYLENIETLPYEFKIDKWVRVTGQAEDFLFELENAEAVFIRGLTSIDRNTVIKYCVARDIESYIYPKIGDMVLSAAEQLHMFHVPVMRVYRYSPSGEFVIIKRAFDILFSIIFIILSSPFMLITALAIRLYDGGPAFYKQVRMTKNGKQFKILKFRSMCVNAEKDNRARLSTENDDRITPVGKVIRAIRFDELPQLFNILRGDMSVVGPRPERPEIADQYTKTLPEFALRLQAKAGLTGYAQVYGKYNSTPYDKLQMDLLYIARPSMLMDLKLVLMTFKILFVKESTEGIKEGQLTAGDVKNDD